MWRNKSETCSFNLYNNYKDIVTYIKDLCLKLWLNKWVVRKSSSKALLGASEPEMFAYLLEEYGSLFILSSTLIQFSSEDLKNFFLCRVGLFFHKVSDDAPHRSNIWTQVKESFQWSGSLWSKIFPHLSFSINANSYEIFVKI